MSEKQLTGQVEGVLVYAKIAEADKKYKSDDTEYSIGVIIDDEDIADDWDARFKKQPAEKFKATQFKDKFKTELPEEFEGSKNLWKLTLKRPAVIDGEEKYPQFRPRVFLDTEDERIDITESRLIANGSRGIVSYRVSENKEYGDIVRLANVLIPEETFIEYKSTFAEAGSEFGDKPIKKEEARKSATEARKTKQEAEEKPAKAGDEFGDKPAKKETAKKAPAKKVTKEEPKAKADDAPWDDDVPY